MNVKKNKFGQNSAGIECSKESLGAPPCHNQSANAPDPKAQERAKCHCCRGKNEGGKHAQQPCCCADAQKSEANGEKMFCEGFILAIAAISIALSFFLTASGATLPYYPLTDPSWIAVLLCAVPIFRSAARALFAGGRLTSSALVSVAMLGAFALEAAELCGWSAHSEHGHSYIFAAAEIAFLMRLGSWIENRTAKKSRRDIEKLADMIPPVAYLKCGEEEREIPAKDIKAGDVLCVRPASVFPCDAEVIRGESTVDESAITGESLPAEKAAGSAVYAGTSNISGYLEVRALKRTEESEMAKMAKLVDEASGKSAPISRTADKWASMVIPAAIVCSFIVFIASKSLLGVDYMEAAIRGVTVLVVFCPCAFVLATPTAVAAALGNAAKRGILFKSGEALEKLSKCSRVFFDKTGTLTTAKIAVEKFLNLGQFGDKEILSLAGCAEKRSDHPVAKAIYAYAKSRVEVPEPDSTNSRAGVGIEATFGKNKVSLQRPNAEESAAGAIQLTSGGYTAVEVKINGKSAAFFGLSDTLRDSSKEAVESIKSEGISCAVISGDNLPAAEKIARSCGIEEVFAPVLPPDKLRIISEFQSRGENICMVGDGVNDAPALAGAYSSIAMASLKNGIAIEAAQISIAGDDIRAVPYGIRLSRHALKTIRANIAFSIFFNLGALALAFFGVINPVAGALVHNLSSICVVLNSARILKYK